MQTDPLIGANAGNYTLEGRIGSGGMGDVYRGVQRVVGAKVAVKILHATTARDPEAATRFQIEAQAGNRIEHPGVIKVLDAGQLPDGRPYLVMPLLDGKSLAEHLATTPRLPIPEACQIAVDVLDAVAAAHAKGFVHRDLKPPNVFLTSEGRIVILDFGVAKLMAVDSPAPLTRTGTAVGTPYYMAPEQIKEQRVGPHTDVYAVGVVLFEMLCGRPPFDGPSAFDVMAGHLERRPPPPRALRPDIPVPVHEVVLASLAKDPAKRFRNAGAMRDALRTAAGVRASQPDLRKLSNPKLDKPAIAGVEPLDAMGPTLRRHISVPPAAAPAAAAAPAHAGAAPRPAPPPPAPAPAPARAPASPAPRSSLGRILPWAIAVIAISAAAATFVLTRGDKPRADPAAGSGSAIVEPPVVTPPIVTPTIVTPIDAAPPRIMDPASIKPPMHTRHVDARPAADSGLDPELAPFDDGLGTIHVDTSPVEAEIFIDGKRASLSPCARDVPEGKHEVEARLAGYRTSTTLVDVKAGETTMVDIVLDKHNDMFDSPHGNDD